MQSCQQLLGRGADEGRDGSRRSLQDRHYQNQEASPRILWSRHLCQHDRSLWWVWTVTITGCEDTVKRHIAEKHTLIFRGDFFFFFYLHLILTFINSNNCSVNKAQRAICQNDKRKIFYTFKMVILLAQGKNKSQKVSCWRLTTPASVLALIWCIKYTSCVLKIPFL